MYQDMRGRSWRSLAGSAVARLAPLKDYIVQRDLRPTRSDLLPTESGYPDGTAKKPSWSQRLAKRSNSDPDEVASTEKVVLLPGWASKTYRTQIEPSNHAGSPYDIDIFLSGYVVKDKANTLSRSQRTLLRLAKSFASLPKLPDPDPYDESEDNWPNGSSASGSQGWSKSTEDLLAGKELPPRPYEITEEIEQQALRRLQPDVSSGVASTLTTSSPASLSSTPACSTPELPPVLPSNGASGEDVLRWHTNLETRLRPFWSGVLSNRTLRVSVRPSLDSTGTEDELSDTTSRVLLEKPLAEESIITDANGAFKIRIPISWDTLCAHPSGALTLVDSKREQDVFITVELMPSPPSRPQTPNESNSPGIPSTSLSVPTVILTERVPLTHCPTRVRVISDIDDTVKMSGVSCGARIVFHNVFVKDLEENLIPGMGEWYSEMWRRGVRFHYVSNGPFELLPVISDFFQLARLPAGSVRLRSYGTRSLFSGLLSGPADRKRDGVVEVLVSFPDSSFILVGDSGEQDLELYASIAREYPHRISCIFIRDVNTYDDGGGGIEDPTGIYVRQGWITAQDLQAKKKGQPSGSTSRAGPRTPRSMSSQLLPPPPAVSRAPSGSTDDTIRNLVNETGPSKLCMDPLPSESWSDGMSPSLAPSTMIARMPDSESDKKRLNLQIRLWKACVGLPTSTVVRVFCEPQECGVEAFEVIRQST